MNIRRKLILERGVDLENAPETYLSKAKKEVNSFRGYANLFKEIIQMLKDMSWKDITFVDGSTSGGTSYQFPLLPAPILAKIEEAYRANNNKAKADFRQGSYGFLKTFGFNTPDTGNVIHMKVEAPSDRGAGQRSHFPNSGIPNALRGTALGYKLYRALLQKWKFLQSNTAGTREKDYAWQSMVSTKKDAQGRLTDDDVHAIVGPSNVLAIIKSAPDASKIKWAKSFIDATINKDGITSRNFIIDPELLALLPDTYKNEIDPVRREATRAEREAAAKREREAAEARLLSTNAARFELYAPFGPDAHNWEIGDYIVLRQYLMDPSYTNLPVRRVVQKNGNEWVALSIGSLQAYVQNGTLSDTRTTTRKTDWVKTKLKRGQFNYMPDPYEGQTISAGSGGGTATPAATPTTNATQDQPEEMTPQQKRAIRNFMRDGEYHVCMASTDWDNRNDYARRHKPIPTYLVKKIGTGRSATYKVMNARNAQLRNNLSGADYEALGLKKFDVTQLVNKASVTTNDWVFVKEHRASQGYACVVHRITPASNRQPGVYIWTGETRPQYIGQPSILWKMIPAANESYSTNLYRFGELFESNIFEYKQNELKDIAENIAFMLDENDIKHDLKVNNHSLKNDSFEFNIGGDIINVEETEGTYVITSKHMDDVTCENEEELMSWWSQYVGSHKSGEAEFNRESDR